MATGSNIAVRLEGIADPGGHPDVREGLQARSKAKFGTGWLRGSRASSNLKNIAKPVSPPYARMHGRA